MLAALKLGPYLALALMGAYIMVLRANIETLETQAGVYAANEEICKNEVAEGNSQIKQCLDNTAGLLTTVSFHQDQATGARETYDRRLEDINLYERKLKDAVTADPSRAADDSTQRKFDRMQRIQAVTGSSRSGEDRDTSAKIQTSETSDNQLTAGSD